MRGLAEFSMRGRRHAVAVSVVGATLPFFFWISAAVTGLVLLRRGFREGLLVGIWAMLPASCWLIWFQDSTPGLVIIGTAVLALVLRETMSWVYTLLVSVVLGIAAIGFIRVAQPELFEQALGLMRDLFAGMQTGLPPEKVAEVEPMLVHLLSGAWGLVESLSMLSCLVLARWWQALLYNPGGFGKEFHALRLPPGIAVMLLGVMLLGPAVSPAMVGWMPVISVPLMIAGVALVHGLVGLRGLGSGWLFAFYATLLLVSQFMVPVLVFIAFLDSLVDFRARARNNPPPPGDDETL